MLHVVTPQTRSSYSDLLQAMFALRYKVCVKTWLWQLPDTKNEIDIDEFDGENTIYLIVTCNNNKVIHAAARLNNTAGKNMMDSLFTSYCQLQPAPRSPFYFEFSRYVPNYWVERDIWRRAMGELEYGATSLALSCGIEGYTWFSFDHLYNHSRRGWNTKPLGLPSYFPDDNGRYIAAKASIRDDDCANVAKIYNFKVEDTKPIHNTIDWAKDQINDVMSLYIKQEAVA